jgi:hypothetical protein
VLGFDSFDGKVGDLVHGWTPSAAMMGVTIYMQGPNLLR